MFITIDRAVISFVEKFTQSLQRNYGIEVSSICSFFAFVVIVCIFAGWYFKGPVNAYITIISSLIVLGMVSYILFFSKKHQLAVEKWALKGVSNRFKISSFGISFRATIFLVTFIEVVIALLSEFFASPIGHVYNISLVVFFYALSADALPPSSSKGENWLQNLFRKRSLST